MSDVRTSELNFIQRFAPVTIDYTPQIAKWRALEFRHMDSLPQRTSLDGS